MLHDKGKTALAGEMLSESHVPDNAEMRPDGGEWPLMLMEMSDTSLHPDVKLLCRIPVASPPVHGEVPSSVTKQMLEGEAVSKEEGTSTPEYSPVPSAALTLPKRTPVLSIWAVSSRQGRNKSQPPRSTLVTPG